MNKLFGTDAKMPNAGRHEKQQKKILSWLDIYRQYKMSLLVGLIGLVLSLTAFIVVDQWEIQSRKLEFKGMAEARCQLFEQEVRWDLVRLLALRQFFAGSQFVDRNEFVIFIEPLHRERNHPASFHWAPRVLDSDRRAFEKATQAEGYANFNVHCNLLTDSIAVLTQHREYYPVLYCCHDAKWLMGFDMFSEPNLRKAIERAIDTDQPVITTSATLPRGQMDWPDVILLYPVYYKNLPVTTVADRRMAVEGVVVCVTNVKNLFDKVIHVLSPAGINMEIADVSTAEDRQLLYQYNARLTGGDTGDEPNEESETSGLVYTTTFDIADRTWETRATPSPGYLAIHFVWVPKIVFLGGLLLTALLVILFYSMRTRTITVEKLVTDRTAQLQESEQKHRLLADNATDIIWTTDLNLKFTYFSPSVERIRGYAVEEAIAQPIEESLTPDSYRSAMNLFQEEMGLLLEGGYPAGKVIIANLELTCRDGSTVWTEASMQLLFDDERNPMGVLGISRDITERKQATEKLSNSEHTWRTTFDSMIDWVSLIDSKTFTVINTNKVGEEITGFPINDIIGNKCHKMIHNLDGPPSDCPVQRLLKSKKREETEMKLGVDGPWILVSVDPIFDENKEVVTVVHIVKDITERKQAEEKLRENEEKFRKYVSCAPVGIFIVDSQGSYVDVNETACELTGYSRSEILSMSILDLAASEAPPEVLGDFEKLKETGRMSSGVKLKHKNGSIIWTLLDAVALSEDRFMAFCSDITETRRLQELESRAERLETAGTIAGQVAHDFNNLLGPIIAYPEMIREELPHDHKAREYIDVIEYAARRIAEINQDLLTMGRRGHYSQDVLDLNDIVLRAVQGINLRAETVICENDLCEDLLRIKGGSTQLHRMLTNLLANAQDAMNDIGRITIKTENYYADDTSIAYGRVPRGEYVKLTVSDDGCGIPDEIIHKILDPFFTTKTSTKKRGSGLGLSVVDAVMKDHNGYLDLSSEIGHGTSFYLYFPITREEVGEDRSGDLVCGTEKVLIVDDDKMQRDVTSQLLTKLGYRISSVESGEKAVEFLRENPQDLVILDMVMPGGIDGTETYRQILEVSPDQKAIILSGFSEADRVLEAQKLGAGAFVRKPITKQVIAAAVRTELNRKVEVVLS